MRRLATILLCMCFVCAAKAQLNDSINTHVIIAFDNSISSNLVGALSAPHGLAETAINKTLAKLSLGPNDYYSMVNFILARGDSHFKSFAVPSRDKRGMPILWKPVKTTSTITSENGNWSDIAYGQGQARFGGIGGGGPYSLLSGAKQYSLKAAMSKGTHHANRTIMLVVTDEYYNGGDNYRKEIEGIFGKGTSQVKQFEHDNELVNGNYSFLSLDDYTRSVIDGTSYKVYAYEVMPNVSYALGTIISFPADMGLTRERGQYRIRFKYTNLESNHEIKKIVMKVKSKDNDYITQEFFTDAIDMEIDDSDLSGDSLEVTMQGWVLLNDSVYSGLLMNPNDKKYSRLNVHRTLPLDGGEKVLGILPMWDIFWFPFLSNHAAVLLWDFVLVLIFTVTILFFGYKWFSKITRYVPSNDKIKLTKINGNHN